jgi:hypothetical protein
MPPVRHSNFCDWPSRSVDRPAALSRRDADVVLTALAGPVHRPGAETGIRTTGTDPADAHEPVFADARVGFGVGVGNAAAGQLRCRMAGDALYAPRSTM